MSDLANFDEVQQIQRSIYVTMKKRALELEGHASAEMSRYRKAQERLGKKIFESVPLAELFDRLDRSRVVYLGDFHTFDQSSRTLERLLRHMLRHKGKPLALGMEMIHEKDQFVLDSFIQGLLSEQEFLESINYHESWRFPWHHYRPFFELAKSKKLEIIALNSNGSLSARDERAAQLIANFAKAHMGTTLLVLFGELHIVADKLPKQTQKLLGIDVGQCIIHQNLDSVYWKKGSSDDASLVRFNENEFSLQSSPPWVKYESMLYWYENVAEDADFDIHTSAMDGASDDAAENFMFYIGRINRSFKLNLNQDDLEDFNLFDQQQLDIVLDRIDENSGPSIAKWQREQIRRGKAFKLIGGRNYYCPHFSVNRLAYLAGIHLQDHLRSRTKLPRVDEMLLSRGALKRFLGLFHSMLLAYLCAKVINPYRKCDLYQDFLEKSRQAKLHPKTRANLKVILKLFALKTGEEDEITEILKGQAIDDLAYIAKRLAHAVGDTLYHEFFTLRPEEFQKITRQTVLEKWNAAGFISIIRSVFPGKSYQKTKKRFF